ncbi:uncharacterized protein TrAtP1_002830 [Trichoderma atroviride]|uniref:Uncharacterized protein n=1 Tax=Hypocrea atroviridis (strain ATCC 20476 / IMI 206040) TaxID=452589 RepID=G9NXA3_HYPAI|nr:uncharacterized protein TRIATDRAFT_318320 [Trichoderma atroviride IMI 206040]EHK44714.1 hypothetical protein TRIATDRAFT_318320 [Trichoderma atroviride IMI 206040]UKZ61571.1 hypothetical protein TrAtP1_002830 [Trichoderma atroviride]
MASEKSKERLNEELNKEVTTIPNAATVSPMSTAARIGQINNQLPPKQPRMVKLQGRENRKAWLDALTVRATDLRFWNVITGKEVKPKDATKLPNWKQKNLGAMELLLNSLSQEMHVKLKQLNLSTTTSEDLMEQILGITFNETEIERFKLVEDFIWRFNPTDRDSFPSTEAFLTQLVEEWTKIKAKCPDAPDEWLNMVASTGIESLHKPVDELLVFWVMSD